VRTTPRRLHALPLLDFASELAGYSDPAFSVAGDGSIYAIARVSDESPVIDQGIGTFPKGKFEVPTEYVVHRWCRGDVERITIRDESLVLHHVQPMPDGLLFVAARSHWRPQGAGANAVVYDRDGRELRRFLLGDGANDVRTTPDGTIWVSYFDEGVFGNFGWGRPGPEPIGAPGLRAFSATGEPVFAYDAERAGTDIICDAYALNVARDGSAWVYFHTEFPIVRVHGGEYRVWGLGVAGAHAIAIDGDRALLVGDYEHPALARVVRLPPGPRASVVEEVILVDEAGKSIEHARASAVGPEVFLFQDSRALVVRGW